MYAHAQHTLGQACALRAWALGVPPTRGLHCQLPPVRAPAANSFPRSVAPPPAMQTGGDSAPHRCALSRSRGCLQARCQPCTRCLPGARSQLERKLLRRVLHCPSGYPSTPAPAQDKSPQSCPSSCLRARPSLQMLEVLKHASGGLKAEVLSHAPICVWGAAGSQMLHTIKGRPGHSQTEKKAEEGPERQHSGD